MKRSGQAVPTLHSRPPLERMLRIHEAIQARRYPNASTLGRGLEVSPKSITATCLSGTGTPLA